ncbi:MAG: hypothetical protein JXB88_24775 [Spirochaetales bacterium]|nr:hypothetical protein [Spirochaetales bacterium]
MFENLDYYEVLKEQSYSGLDPSESREENLKRLNSYYNKYKGSTHRTEIRVLTLLISRAQAVFGNENEYNKFRKWRLERRLLPFIEGALCTTDNGKVLLKDKIDEAIDRGRQDGHTEDEVKDVINSLHVTVQDKLKTKSDFDFRNIVSALNKIKFYLAGALGAAVLITFITLFVINSNKIVPAHNDDKLLAETIEYLDATSSPLWSKLDESITVLLANRNNEKYKAVIEEKLDGIKQYCLKMGKEAPNNEEARDWFEMALKIDPGNPEIRELLGNL